MSKLGRKLKRKDVVGKHKKLRRDYLRNRDVGSCYVESCQVNGDLTTHCQFCDFSVQACPGHWEFARSKAKRHVLTRHPTKVLPTLMMGVLRGDRLE